MRAWPVAACLLACPAAAHADNGGYFQWGMSPGHRLEGDLARHFDTDDEVGGRLAIGTRSDDTAFELAFFGTDMHPIGVSGYDTYDSSTLSLSIGIKQFAAVDDHVDLFARIALDQTWMEPFGEYGGDSLSGMGLDYGAGVEAGTRHDRWGIRFFLDVGQQRNRLRGNGETYRTTFTAVTAGITVLCDP